MFIQLDVTCIEGGGTGLTSFGADTNIFVSIFSDYREIDEGLSQVEGRTTNTSSLGTQTSFGGTVNLAHSRIINLASPAANGDDVSVAYLQGQIAPFITQAQAAGEFLSIANANSFYALISSLTDYLTESEAASERIVVPRRFPVSMSPLRSTGLESRSVHWPVSDKCYSPLLCLDIAMQPVRTSGNTELPPASNSRHATRSH